MDGADMRIKFREGVTIEHICDILIAMVRENNKIIGGVDVRMDIYGDDGKLLPKASDDKEYIIFTPDEALKQEYADDVVWIRRSKIGAVK